MNLRLCLKLDKKNIYVVSVSGGVDSMVLLDYLYKLKYLLVVVHFNHLKRKNSFEDKILIQKYCIIKKIPFYYFELNIPKKNFQNQARLLRKEKLKQIAFQYKTFYLITAHHLDDLAENVLFKIARGSSILGYSGMQLSYCVDNFYFLKPFLYISKQQILNYAHENKIIFLEDYTNKLNIYNRNKIRNKIIPSFKEINNFLKNIKKFHFQFTEIHNFIRKQTYFFLQNKKDKDIFDLKLFLKLDIVIQKDIILFFLEEKNITKNFDLINNIVQFLKNRCKPNIEYYFNSNWKLIKKYDIFYWQKEKIKNNSDMIYNQKPLLHYSSEESLLFLCSLKQKIFYDKNNIIPPFILRKKKPGDILQFRFGTQKLNFFFINSKIPLLERNKFWLVVDQKNTIIWIPELYLNNTLGNANNIYLCLQKK